MTSDFDGSIAIVTGAARRDGIGFEICNTLLERGVAGIVLTDIDVENGRLSEAELSARFGADKVLFSEHDATSEDAWVSVLDLTLDRFGSLAILVNNVGASFGGTIQETPLSDLRKGMAINLDSQYLGIRTCAAALARGAAARPGGAAIVNNSSMAAYLDRSASISYSLGKSASRMLTMCAAREYGPQKIRVNSVHYGPIMTGPLRQMLREFAGADEIGLDEAAKGLAAQSPLGIVGTPKDAAALVAFLASDEARFVTGAAFIQDGGSFVQY